MGKDDPSGRLGPEHFSPMQITQSGSVGIVTEGLNFTIRIYCVLQIAVVFFFLLSRGSYLCFSFCLSYCVLKRFSVYMYIISDSLCWEREQHVWLFLVQPHQITQVSHIFFRESPESTRIRISRKNSSITAAFTVLSRRDMDLNTYNTALEGEISARHSRDKEGEGGKTHWFYFLLFMQTWTVTIHSA